MTSRLRIVRAFVAKDLRIHARDRFFVVMTFVGLLFFIGVFWLLPAQTDETLRLGVHVEGPNPLAMLSDDEGIHIVTFDSGEQLEDAVRQGGDIVAGLDLGDLAAPGDAQPARVILSADAPEELRTALTAMVRELAFAITGQPPPITAPDADAIVLGPDLAGQQPSLRDQLRPMFIFLALFVEMFALASLVAVEIQQRTISAVLATPVRIGDVLVSKTVIGTLLAFGQALVLLVATGAAGTGLLLLVVALLLGAVLVTAVGLIAGTSGKDFVEVVFWSMLIGLPLLVPAIGSLFPGSPPAWIQLLPSYGLVQIMIGTTSLGHGWSEALGHLAALAGWCVVLFAVGIVVLRRRVARL